MFYHIELLFRKYIFTLHQERPGEQWGETGLKVGGMKEKMSNNKVIARREENETLHLEGRLSRGWGGAGVEGIQ